MDGQAMLEKAIEYFGPNMLLIAGVIYLLKNLPFLETSELYKQGLLPRLIKPEPYNRLNEGLADNLIYKSYSSIINNIKHFLISFIFNFINFYYLHFFLKIKL